MTIAGSNATDETAYKESLKESKLHFAMSLNKVRSSAFCNLKERGIEITASQFPPLRHELTFRIPLWFD